MSECVRVCVCVHLSEELKKADAAVCCVLCVCVWVCVCVCCILGH